MRAKLSDCYVARFDIEGRLKSLKRHEPDVGLQYFANGRLRKFGAKTKEGYQYLSYWDENGIFVREGVSRGIIGEIKDGKYIKYPNHPDFEKPIP